MELKDCLRVQMQVFSHRAIQGLLRADRQAIIRSKNQTEKSLLIFKWISYMWLARQVLIRLAQEWQVKVNLSMLMAVRKQQLEVFCHNIPISQRIIRVHQQLKKKRQGDKFSLKMVKQWLSLRIVQTSSS